MIANDPNVSMAERMAFSRHSNAQSHIAYIRAGHNSDFSFQKAVSGAPMPKKKVILRKKAVATKAFKASQKEAQKKATSTIFKKATACKPNVARKAIAPKAPRYMKSPPQSSISPPATRAAVRMSKRAPKPKKRA
jgi:hypothetical protein